MGGKIIPFSKLWEKALVRSYCGYRVNEEPRSLYRLGEWVPIDEVLDRWYDPDHNYFKVRTRTGDIYLLKWSSEEDTWYLKRL